MLIQRHHRHGAYRYSTVFQCNLLNSTNAMAMARYVSGTRVFILFGYATWTGYSLMNEFESPQMDSHHNDPYQNWSFHSHSLQLAWSEFWISTDLQALKSPHGILVHNLYPYMHVYTVYMTVTDALSVAYTATLCQCGKPYQTVFSGKQICLRVAWCKSIGIPIQLYPWFSSRPT